MLQLSLKHYLVSRCFLSFNRKCPLSSEQVSMATYQLPYLRLQSFKTNVCSLIDNIFFSFSLNEHAYCLNIQPLSENS